MQVKELAKNLRGKPDFEAFQEYVLSQVSELDTVDGLDSMSNEMAGETAKVRLLAVAKIQEIFRPFIEFSEKHEYTPEEIKEAAARRGLS